MTRDIKWSQWDINWGMVAHGYKDYNTLRKWMTDCGLKAAEALKANEDRSVRHICYGRIMYDKDDNPAEFRFYTGMFYTDDELDRLSQSLPKDRLFVAHKL